MFESFDIDRNGKIDADELGRALAHYEYVLRPLISPDPFFDGEDHSV
jgi:Ca2+-binding EF-hand superfamily protein